MSAFIVSNDHINALVRFASVYDLGYYHSASETHVRVPGNEDIVAQMLLDENVRSVNFRYGDTAQADRISYDINAPRLTAVQTIKAAACLEYQSCETSGWTDSEAKALLDSIRSEAIAQLPGYAEAAWSL